MKFEKNMLAAAILTLCLASVSVDGTENPGRKEKNMLKIERTAAHEGCDWDYCRIHPIPQ